MRKYKIDQGFILTNLKTAELFCILGFARTKLTGKLRTDCERYWKEFEKALGLDVQLHELNKKDDSLSVETPKNYIPTNEVKV